MSYKHLTPESREIILRGIIAGCSFTEISKSVGCNKSTVSREIKRNGGRNGTAAIRLRRGIPWREKRAGENISFCQTKRCSE